MARVPYLEADDLPDDRSHLIESGTVSPGDPLHVRQVIAHDLDLLAAHDEFGIAVRDQRGLTVRRRELVILAVARALQSRYVWHEHVTFACEDILTSEEIRAVARGEFDALPAPDAALVQYVTRFVAMDVTDDDHDALAEHCTDEEVVGIGMLARTYVGLAHLLDAFDVEIEQGPFVGWDLDDARHPGDESRDE